MEDDEFDLMLLQIAMYRSRRRSLIAEAAAVERTERPIFWAAWEVWQGGLSPRSRYYSRPRGMMEFSDLIERMCREE